MTVLLNHIRKKAEADHNKKSVSAVLNRKTVDFEAEFGVPNIAAEYSAEVQAVFDNMPNPLTEAEKTAIDSFVTAAVASGNWDELDRFFFFALSDPDNALTDWKTGNTATNVNGATHTEGRGYAFNGSTQYIDTEYQYNALSKYSILSARTGAYLYQTNDQGTTRQLFGVNDDVYATQIYSDNGNVINYRVNWNFAENIGIGQISADFQNNTRYEIERTANDTTSLYINGTVNNTDIEAMSPGLPTVKTFIGGNNYPPLGGLSIPLDGTVSYHFAASANIDGNAWDTELTQLENDLIQ